MSASRWVHHFSDPLPADCTDARALLGGKGASLKEMTLAGLHVPPGFTISTTACVRYFELGHAWPEGLEEEVRTHLSRLEQETGRELGRTSRPLLVAVRSGAAVSMPGMMDTLLNCGLNPALAAECGDAPWFWERYLQFVLAFARTVAGLKQDQLAADSGLLPARARAEAALTRYAELTGRELPAGPWDALCACINAVFESWFSERAAAYRERHGLRGPGGTAVNVQMMFPSEVSGVLFTQDPNNLPAEQMVLEASYGLGEAVVSGDVSPDRFIVSRNDFGKLQTSVGRKTSVVAAFGERRAVSPDALSLTPAQVAELCALALKIEKHFDCAVDIEWGWADGRFALLQARPIRGLEVAQEVETSRKAEVERLRALAGTTRRVWVAHNLGETLRAPMPLTWDIIRRFMSGAGGFGRLYRDLGYRPSRRVMQHGFLEAVCGRLYADPERLAELFWDGMPLTYDLDALVRDRSLLDRAPDKFDAARTDGLFLWRLPANLWAMWRAARNMRRAQAEAKRLFDTVVLPPFLAYAEQKRAQDLAKLQDAEVLHELRARCQRVLDEFAPESLKPGFFGGLAFDKVERLLVQLMGEHEGEALAQTLTLALDGDVTFEQEALLYRVAKGESDLPAFLQRFGHRCVNEMELAAPRWREDARYVEQNIARYKKAAAASPDDMHRRNLERRNAAEAELPARLERWGGSSFREELEKDLAAARALLPYRETGKYYLMMGYDLLRMAVQELGARWGLGNGMYFLQLDELGGFTQDRANLETEVEKRKTRWQAFQRLELPDVIDSQHLDQLGLAQHVEAAQELAGTALAPGAATGTARIVTDPQEAGELGADYVLVCASTDPGWTPLFVNARALVVERGGVLSHGAIVARDFGIPAVACPHATKLLRAGDTVRVDGNQGKVLVLAEERAEAHG